MKVEKLLRDLIKIPSPSGGEREIGNFVAIRLKKNFVIKKQRVGKNFNVLAYIGKPKILLTTHLDTIPEQLKIREESKFIYGRGACDAKASIASMIIAGEKAAEEGARNFGMLFDVGEETDFSGIKKAINLVKPDYVIIGEPTNFDVVTGQKGLIGIKIKCFGKSAPGSMPERGISAIDKLLKDLDKLKRISLPIDKFLGKTTLNIGKMYSGISANVVPDYAEASVEIRTTTNNNKILRLLRKKRINFNILYNFEPVLLKNNFIKALKFKEVIAPYFTEMYFWNKKTKVIVFGPGNYQYAHSKNEKIKKCDLEKAALEYLRIITYLNQEKLNIQKRKMDNLT